MKKKRIDANNRIYHIAALPNPNANQIKLKQVYDSAFKSRQKSPKVSSIKKDTHYRYQLPQSQNKHQHNKINKYKAYLQNQLIPKIKHNRRYSRKHQKQQDQRPYIPAAITSRAQRNQSVDMFKIRKSKVNSSYKVSASSYTRLQQNTNDFQNAKSLYKQSKFQQALQIAEQCLQKDSKNYQYQYYTAIICLNLHNYTRGLQLLEKVCRDHGEYKKTAYLFAVISAKNLQQFQKAIKLCTWGLQRYPNYLQLLLYRANLYQLGHKYEEAHIDYTLYLKTDKNNVQILLKNAECLKKTQSYANCLSNLAAALYADNGERKQQIVLKRIEIYLMPKSYNLKQAKKDLNKLMQLNSAAPEKCYIKGIILSAQGFRKESLLSFEQCLKQSSSKQIMSKALVQIVKSKIEDRDFYSASYHINRYKYLQLSSQQIEIYKLFSQGVVHLMKRKVAEADHNFTNLLTKYKNLPSFLKKIFYLYQAFAKFYLSQYEQAIQSYQLANQQQPIDIFAKFNKQIAQGIVYIKNTNYQKGFQYFNTAQKTISLAKLNKIDSNLYRAAAHIQQAKDLMKSQNDQQLKSLQQMFAGLKQLDQAYDVNDSNSNMLYYRSLVYLYLGKYNQALQDIIKAISKSQQNVAKYFFFRALTHSSLGNKKQALNDLNICNNLDQKFLLVYLQRAKINFYNQNITKGLQDLMKLKNLQPKQDIKYHEACLNYFNGHYAMANACCDQIADQNKARQIKILIKTKLGKLKQGRKLLKTKADIMIYQILQGKTQKQQQPSSDLQFFKLYHYHHYLAIKYFRRSDYVRSIDTFIMASKQRNLYDLQQGVSNNSLAQQQQQQSTKNFDSESDTIHKINFNIFLCYLKNKDWKKAYQIFIRDVIGVKQQFLKNEFIATLSHLLFQAIKQSKNTVKQQQKQVYQLNLYESKLDRTLPQIFIELPNFIIKTRLCLLGLTNTKLQQIYKTKANPQFILQYMKISQIQNRPQPPWVKRQQSGLIFTDQVQNINIQFQTTQNDDEQNDDEQQQQAQQSEEQGQEQAEPDQYQQQEQKPNRKQNQKLSVRKFKQKMKLNDSMERKLQKIMEMKKKSNNINNQI